MNLPLYKITQKQYKSDGSNFHVGKIENLESEKSFVWVYDCGHLPKDFNEKVDVIYISHFDWDHIKCAQDLLNKNKNKNAIVVGPYVRKDIIVSFLYKLFQKKELFDGILNLAVNAYINSNNSETDDAVIYYMGDRSEGEENTDKNGLEGLSKADNKTLSYIKKTIGNISFNWGFITFAYRDKNKKESIFDDITDDDIKNCISDKNKRKEFIQKVKTIIKTRNIKDNRVDNIISLCLYSGPISHTYLGHYFFLCHLCNGYCRYRCRSAWLHTGDSCFASKDGSDLVYNSFLKIYQRFSMNIGTFVLPHHGLKNSQNEKVYTDFPFANLLIAPFTKYKTLYDFCDIEDRLYWTKECNYSTVSFQSFCDICKIMKSDTTITEKQLFYPNKSKYISVEFEKPNKEINKRSK